MIEAVPNTATYKAEAKPSLISLINDEAKPSYLFLRYYSMLRFLTWLHPDQEHKKVHSEDLWAPS